MEERLEVNPGPARRNQGVCAERATIVKAALDDNVNWKERKENKDPDKNVAKDIAFINGLLSEGRWLYSAHELLSNTFARLILQSDRPPIIKKITIEIAEANPKFDVVPLKAVL